jgi:hypothetical protein
LQDCSTSMRSEQFLCNLGITISLLKLSNGDETGQQPRAKVSLENSAVCT